MRQRRGQVVIHDVDLAGQRVVQRRAHAAVRHVHQVGARGHLEQLAHHVRDRAVAGRRVGQLARFALGQLDQVGDVLGRNLGVDGHDVRHGGQVRDGREVLLAVERQVRVDGRVDAVRADGGDAQDVAVGRAAGDEGAADRTAGAAAVFDHHGLAQFLAQLVGEQAADDVGRASGRERNDQADGLGRIRVFCVRDTRGERRGQGRGGDAQAQDNFTALHGFPY